MKIEVIVICHKNYLVSMTIRNIDGSEIRLTWSEIQAIKHTYAGNVRMYEVYPLEQYAVTHSNERHFWSRAAIDYGLNIFSFENMDEADCSVEFAYADLPVMEQKNLLVEYTDSLRAYELQAQKSIAMDERDSYEFVDIFLTEFKHIEQ